jgi:hypothetical protein
VRRALLIAVLLVSLAPAASASAAPCGPSTRAALELDPDSVTSIEFGRATDAQKLLIRFKAGNCTLPEDAKKPTIDVLPKQSAKNVPDDVLTLTRWIADGSDYSLTFSADPKRFDPGTYAGFVEVRAPYLVTTRAPIALSRSEDSEWMIFVLGFFGGTVSLIWFLGLRMAKGATTPFKLWHYVFAFGAAAIAGVIAVDTAYRSQDVWSFSENAGSALVAAFTGATTGAMVAALAVLFPDPSGGQEDEEDGAGP